MRIAALPDSEAFRDVSSGDSNTRIPRAQIRAICRFGYLTTRRPRIARLRQRCASGDVVSRGGLIVCGNPGQQYLARDRSQERVGRVDNSI